MLYGVIHRILNPTKLNYRMVFFKNDKYYKDSQQSSFHRPTYRSHHTRKMPKYDVKNTKWACRKSK